MKVRMNENGGYVDTTAYLPPLHTVREAVATNTKTYTVPANERWRLQWAHIQYTAQNTFAARQIRMALTNSSDELLVDKHTGATQPINTTRHHAFTPGTFRETSFVASTEIEVPFPLTFDLMAGEKLIFEDSGDQDATDTMIVAFRVERYYLG